MSRRRHPRGHHPGRRGAHTGIKSIDDKNYEPEILECKGYKPEYLFFEMCRGASELKDHKPNEGDRYLHPKKKVFVVASYCIQVKGTETFYLAIPSNALKDGFDVNKSDLDSAAHLSDNTRRYEILDIRYWTWLPTPKQFQEMLQPLSSMTILHLFYGFVCQGKGQWHSFEGAPLPDPTMEQLCMFFALSRLYDKMCASFMKGW